MRSPLPSRPRRRASPKVVKKLRENAGDLRGLNRLVIDGIVGVVDVVEAMHYTVARIPGLTAQPPRNRTSGITGLVYRSIRGVAAIVGGVLENLLARVPSALAEPRKSSAREAMLAVINGVLGDYLAVSNNTLAITMCLRRDGIALPQTRESLAAAIPHAGSKVVVLVHGLCMNDLQWKRKGHDHGAALARDLAYTPVYLHYNTGLHISVNGRAFAERLQTLAQCWPVPLTELVILGHSMGGLVARSAYHYGALARHEWVHLVDKLVFLGTPHHGAPLERGGNWVDLLLGMNRYSAPLARLGKIRSAGITDLRFGLLVDEDWSERDRFEPSGDIRAALPLPQRVACYAIAATTGKAAGHLSNRLMGDGIVPLASALGHHANPELALTFRESRRWVAYGTSHLDLLSRPQVYAQIKQWLVESR